jgi:1,4-dihydroxy-2-naphthoyl-CoA hydrolase
VIRVTAPATPRGPFDTNQGVHAALGIEIVELTKERVVIKTPVTSRVHQPHGLLHGGVSALIAESAASVGGMMHVGPGQAVVGIELNASHLRGMSSGTLTATAHPVRVGRRVQVWSIDLTDDDGRMICIARCSLAVIDLPENANTERSDN